MKEIDKNIIELNNISFSYSGSKRKSLDNINLKVKQGEVIVFFGQSGCGKSTLMRLLNGLIPFLYDGELSGTGHVAEHIIGEANISDMSNSVCSVFQDPRSQFFTMDVFSEVAFGGEVRGLDRHELKEKFDILKKAFNLEKILDRKIDKLSSGEKQKVAIASSLMQGSNIILLDEPSANLDIAERDRLGEILLNMKKKGYTIILFEHRLSYIKNVADRYIYINNATIEAQYYGCNELYCEDKKFNYTSSGYENSKEVLRVNNISDGYKKDNLLWTNVSFSAYEGEVIGIWD